MQTCKELIINKIDRTMTMPERNQEAKSSLAAIYCNNQLDVTGAFCYNFSYDFLLWKNANEGICGECLY